MTLPVAPNSIAMSQMNTELGRSASAQLSMSDASLRALIGKGAGAQFSFSELYGASSETISISNISVHRIGIAPGTFQANYQLDADGDIMRNPGNSNALSDGGDWISPKSAATSGNYRVRATLQSGAITSGNADGVTWRTLGVTDLLWRVQRNSVGESAAQILLEIDKASNPGVVLDSAILNLTVTVEF